MFEDLVQCGDLRRDRIVTTGAELGALRALTRLCALEAQHGLDRGRCGHLRGRGRNLGVAELSGLSGLRKDNTGYDLRHLFIGSEGTLGVITAATMKLYPAPKSQLTALAAVPSLAMPGKDHPLLVSIPLDEPEVTRRVGLIRRRGRTLSPAAQQLYDFFADAQQSPAPPKRQGGRSP